MSRNLNNPQPSHRDYGATSSSSNLPDLSFSGFSPTEFMSLSQDIANNISSVNSSSRQLEKLLKRIGTSSDKQTMRDKIHDMNVKSNSLIETITKDLQRLTAVVRRGDKQQKLQLEKLTNDFRSVVEIYSHVQQRLADAMKKTYVQNQLAQDQDEDRETARVNAVREQQQIEASLQFEEQLLIDRDRGMRQIEADILDVNAIMRTIGKIVQEQGEQVDGIESNIENAATEVELGREELAKAASSRQSYRRKILILLVIAVIIGLIVTGIIVGKLSS